MIELPDTRKAFEFENNFYFSCEATRMAKWAAHYELFQKTRDLPGAFVECGLFKGVSFLRFAMFRAIFGNESSLKMIGFDVFGEFPDSSLAEDQKYIDSFVTEAGSQSIDEDQLLGLLKEKGIDKNIELIKGDICLTVPEYLKKESSLRISLLNLDVDIYDPSVTILENLWPRIVKGGILILDDYGKFTGETNAVDEFFKGKDVTIHKFPFCQFPSYIVKNDF
ncbi:dTDP-6-deoxy-L-hexose 3-O-methyltransferase [archaeon]|jgi:hypothetical protein|nr:dTDP-6-deoxy-L-hexose 3-O-methyltransferase [archaeon]